LHGTYAFSTTTLDDNFHTKTVTLGLEYIKVGTLSSIEHINVLEYTLILIIIIFITYIGQKVRYGQDIVQPKMLKIGSSIILYLVYEDRIVYLQDQILKKEHQSNTTWM